MVTKSSAILMEYEFILMGKKEELPKFFFDGDETQNEKMALNVFRYAFERLLQWSPDEVRDGITSELLKKLKLNDLVKYIIFPPELPDKNLYYIAYLLYPQRIRYSKRDFIVSYYRKVVSGEYNKYPKSFFSGISGLNYACVCLQDYITNNLSVSSIEELYALFSTTQISKMLKENGLEIPLSTLFLTPLDYLHTALPEEQRNELYYQFYSFNSLYKGVKNEKKSKKSHI